MALTANPYGFQLISDQSGPHPRRVRIPNGIASGQSGNIFKGMPVTLNAATGTLLPVTLATQRIYGIFDGVEYTPLGGRPAVSPYWPSASVWDPAFDMFAYIYPGWVPTYRFKVQADGSVPQTLLGSQFVISNFTNGITAGGVGLSQATVAAAGVAVNLQGQFVLTEFATDVAVGGGGQSLPGDAFTDLIVAPAFPQIGPGSTTSIG